MDQTPKKSSASEKLEAMKYPIIMIMFILIIFALFFAVARFLSTNINSAIASPDEAQIQAQLTHINGEDYDRVAAKLHLPSMQASSTQVVVIPPEVTPAAGTTTPQSPAIQEPQPVESKSSFIVAVWNSTKKSGLAGTVKNDLAAAGFTIAKVGNIATQEPQTLVQIKEHVQASPAILDEVLSIIGKRFMVGDPQILESTSPYDIVITIGAK